MTSSKQRWALAGWLLAAGVLGGGYAQAQAQTQTQTQTTTVQDTITDASGVSAAGSIVVSWAAFTTTSGTAVPAGSLTTTLGAGGALSVALLPNAGATPMGSYYTAVYHLSDGTTSREFWVVPATGSGAGPVKLAAIRNQVLPTSMAMQTVSKGYVDTTVAKAMAGVGPGGAVPYLLKSGDTMLGALTLTADPVQALQAADKHYVDAAVAAVSVSATGVAGGDLSGNYPNPVVTVVHASSGTMDGVTIGGTTPAPAALSALGVGTPATSAGQVAFSTGAGDEYLGNTQSPGSNRICLSRAGGLQFCVNSATDAATTKNNTLDDGNGNAVFAGTITSPKVQIMAPSTAELDLVAAGGTGGPAASMYFLGGSSYLGYNSSFVIGQTPAVGYPISARFTLDSAGTGTFSGAVMAVGYQEILTTPSSSSAACTAGQFTDDANFHYVCVANNSWKRAALSAF